MELARDRPACNPIQGMPSDELQSQPSGRTSVEHAAFRQTIRQRVLDGKLYWASGRSQVRRGSGRPCAVCSNPIAGDSLEREVMGPRAAQKTVIVHDSSWLLWRDVCRELGPGRLTR